MKTETLRVIQSPLKERYRTDPDAVLMTLKAEGRIGQGLTCREADLDFRGTLGLSKEVAVGFQRSRLHFELATSASDKELATTASDARVVSRSSICLRWSRAFDGFSVR